MLVNTLLIFDTFGHRQWPAVFKSGIKIPCEVIVKTASMPSSSFFTTSAFSVFLEIHGEYSHSE